jgi:prepilin-type N-terminal cleavage/methylation domain-containing protein
MRQIFRIKSRGFSLIELSVVMAIVAFLLGSLMYTLSAQTEQRNFEETRRRLDQARELLFAFAITNGRLPCPARSTSAGAEVRVSDTDAVVANRGKCQDAGAIEDYYGGSPSAGVTGGLLPAQSIGLQHVDAGGFAVDAWGNRIRYAVAKTLLASTCSGTSNTPHFTYLTNLKGNGISCQPNDLLICKSVTASVNPQPNPSASTPSCGGGGSNQIMASGLAVAIVFSTGKNGANISTAGADEAANLKTSASGLSPTINPLFVYHTPTPATVANGEFDDQFTWITVGELYGKLIAAGVLP